MELRIHLMAIPGRLHCIPIAIEPHLRRFGDVWFASYTAARMLEHDVSYDDGGTTVRILALALLTFCFIGPVDAATFCATTSAELETALDTAEINGEADEVRIQTGTYTAPAGGFSYDAIGPPGSDHSIEISGGWTEFFGNECGQVLEEDANLTVLSGEDSDRVMEIFLPGDADADVRLLSFVSGYVSGQLSGGGLHMQATNPYSGTITIERNIFLANEAYIGGGLHLAYTSSSTGNALIVNNLFVTNHARENVGAMNIEVDQSSSATAQRGSTLPAVSVTNNTIVENSLPKIINPPPNLVGGMRIDGTVTNKWVINNNIWSNQATDLFISDGSGLRLWNNNHQSQAGATPMSEQDNISVVPEYLDCGFLCVDRTPVASSPLTDAGTFPQTGHPWIIADTDLRGLTRVREEGIEIGAYENNTLLFSDRFESGL